MSTPKVAEVRDTFSNAWHSASAHWITLPHCGFPTEDRFQAFTIAKDQIQDTAEALITHRRRGFSADPSMAQLELWGIFQAVILQQDAIREMAFAETGTRPGPKDLRTAARDVRKWRNILAGHASWSDKEKDGIKRRSMIARQAGHALRSD